MLTYRRQMPHWRLTGSTYFLTWRVHPEQADLAPDERTLVQDALFHFDGLRYDLLAWVVMNDHVHVVVSPREDQPVESLVHSWKSFTAHAMQRRWGRRGAVWQREYFDRIVRDEDELREKLEYVLGNPAKRWPDQDEPYEWVGLGGRPERHAPARRPVLPVGPASVPVGRAPAGTPVLPVSTTGRCRSR
jgi:REP element-mobilizing transposase RayT